MDLSSKGQWRILLVDDDEDDYFITRSKLRELQGWNVELEWAPTFKAGEQLLRRTTYDAVLVDYDLGSQTGIELIREMVDSGYNTPLILYTGRGSYAVDVEAMQAGAALYLTKGEATPLLLERGIRYAIERKQAEAVLNEANETLQTQAEELEAQADELMVANQQLQAQENELRLIMDATPALLSYVDADYRYRRVNQSYERWFGHTPASIQGKYIWQVLGEAAWQSIRPYAERALSGEVVAYEREIPYQDGGSRWVHATYTPDRDKVGRVRGFVKHVLDIGERKQAEAALSVNEQRLHKLFESMQEVFFVCEVIRDESGKPVDLRYLDVNPACLRRAGRRREEMVGHTYLELFPPNPTFDIWLTQFGRIARTGEASHFEQFAQATGLHFLVNAYSPQPGQVAALLTDITERKQAEEALRESEMRLCIATDAAQLGIHDYDVLRNEIHWDERICSLWGIPLDTPVTYDVFMAGIHPDDRASTQAVVNQALDPQGTGEYLAEYRVISQVDQEERWVLATGLTSFEQGKAARMIGTVQDISARKRAEKALGESEAEYRNLFEHMAEEVHFWQVVRDENGQIKTWRLVDANPPTLKTWGRATIDEIKGLTTDEIFGPGATEHYMPVVSKIMTEGIPYSYEDYFPNLDKYFRFTSVPLGEYFITTGADITNIKKVDQVLRQSQIDLDRAQEVGQIGSWRLDVHRNVLTWSDQNYRIFGVPQGTPLSYETFLECVHPEDRLYVDTQWKAGLTGKPYDLEHRIVAGGEVKWVREKAFLEFDDAGTLLGGFGITQDISHRKLAEKALNDYTEQLRRSNQVLEDFAFIASHDLQEPLRKIQAFGKLLNDGYSQELGDEGQGYIERISQAAGRMQGMLDGLLDYARISSQGQPFVHVDLGEVVDEVLNDLEARLIQTGGQVEASPLPVIEADPLQMRQLFQNLIGNAIKFHRPGVPPRVKISCSPVDENCIALTVADNGVGFDAQNAGYLFKPFHRLHGKMDYEGSGMGLAICHKIVERHAGSITVDSQPGEGSTFQVVLPVLPVG